MSFDLQREMRTYGRQTDIANALGVSRSYVSAVYTGLKPPSDDLLSLLGWEKVTTTKYRRKRQEATNER